MHLSGYFCICPNNVLAELKPLWHTLQWYIGPPSLSRQSPMLSSGTPTNSRYSSIAGTLVFPRGHDNSGGVARVDGSPLGRKRAAATDGDKEVVRCTTAACATKASVRPRSCSGTCSSTLTDACSPNQENDFKNNVKRYESALKFIQQELSKSIYPRIYGIKRAKKAWNILNKRFHSNDKVASVKLQIYLSRVAEIWWIKLKV